MRGVDCKLANLVVWHCACLECEGPSDHHEPFQTCPPKFLKHLHRAAFHTIDALDPVPVCNLIPSLAALVPNVHEAHTEPRTDVQGVLVEGRVDAQAAADTIPLAKSDLEMTALRALSVLIHVQLAISILILCTGVDSIRCSSSVPAGNPSNPSHVSPCMSSSIHSNKVPRVLVHDVTQLT